MDKITIEKGSTAESMMLPLYARAFCDRYFPRTFRESWSEGICGSIPVPWWSIWAAGRT